MSKSTRAFRTISEAGDELDLQPHVLRFWESKFSQIQPMKRSGGRRFYRPEDIEFIRGIKILLHREKHPIKDVQKLIRIRGEQSIIDLGRSKIIASRPKNIKDTDLVPKRIKSTVKKRAIKVAPADDDIVLRPAAEAQKPAAPTVKPTVAPAPVSEPIIDLTQKAEDSVDKEQLRTALEKLRALKSRWEDHK